MSHYDHEIGTKPEGMDDAIYERLRSKVLPLEKPFETGHGRPDLERLYEVVHALDRGHPTILDLRNNLAYYLNNRPDDAGT